MTPFEVVEILDLIAVAPREATRFAHDTYNRMEVNEKIPVMVRARGFSASAFGVKGVEVITINSRQCSYKAGRTAGYVDHYDFRCVEICTEIALSALMAKPYLKPAEFSLLMRPWGPYLGEAYTNEDGCSTEVPPPTQMAAIRNETSTQKKVRMRKEKRTATEDARRERSAIRAEARVQKLKVKRAAEKATIKKHVVNDPPHEAAFSDGPWNEPHQRTLEETILAMSGPIEVVAMPIKAPRIVSENGVRIFYSKRYVKWLLLSPAPSMAMATSDRFDSQDAAREFADANGWPVIGVMIPKGGLP